MSWKPEPELERLVTTIISDRSERMSLSIRDQKGELEAKLSSRGLLLSSGRITGYHEIASRVFGEFAHGMIDDVLRLFRDVYGDVPVEAAPWIRTKLAVALEARARSIQSAEQELAHGMKMNYTIELPSTLGGAHRRLAIELGTVELRARLKELTPPERKPNAHGCVDAFICHASEDKTEAARPIADALGDKGYSVWLDEVELKVGDRLLDKIDSGLVNSRFGIVILSPKFFDKKWARRELAGLVAREDAEERTVILPVWFNVDETDIAQRLPSLAGVFAARMNSGLDAVLEAIVNAMGPPAATS